MTSRPLLHAVLLLVLLMGSLRAAPASLEKFAAASPEGASLAAAFEQARHAARPVEGSEGQWWVQNPANGLNALFTPEGLSMSVAVAGKDGETRRLSTRWRTVGVGYGDNLAAVSGGEVSTSTEPGRVEIVRPGLVEWFVNGRQGLEHGWTLSDRPAGGAGSAPLRVAMALEGDLTAEVAADGRYVVLRDADGAEALRYEKLKVWDAEGRTLISRMVGGGKTLSVEVEDAAAVYPLTIDPVFSQQAYLKASNTGADDFFGNVAISGNTAVVGAAGEDSAATGIDGDQSGNHLEHAGAVYVFVRNGAAWAQQAYLKASNTGEHDRFGESVAISGDTIVVGARREESNAINGDQNNNSAVGAGAAYVFVRSGAAWTQQAYLKASNTRADDEFGSSVAIDGDIIVVGAPKECSPSTGVNGDQSQSQHSIAGYGAAYVFVRNGVTWSQEAYLKASNTGSRDHFGSSVAISGDTVVVGAVGEDSAATGVNGDQSSNEAGKSGAAYVFVRYSFDWVQQAYLKASNTEADDAFASSVAISGDTIMVGALNEDSAAIGIDGDQSSNSAQDSGAAYVFVRNGAAWTQQAYLKASNTGSFDLFGESVAISGDMIVVGATLEDSNATGVDGDQSNDSSLSNGAAYVFVRNGTAWSQRAYLKASRSNRNWFGISVAVSGDTVIVGAPYESSNATGVNGNHSNNGAHRSGAAYIFVLGDEFTPSQSPQPPLTMVQRPKAFPATQVGRKSRTQTLRVSNGGGSPLVGLRVSASGKAKRDFLLVQPARKTLAPGAATTFKATFRPKAKGARKATLEVRGNAPLVKTTLSGKGRAKAR